MVRPIVSKRRAFSAERTALLAGGSTSQAFLVGAGSRHASCQQPDVPYYAPEQLSTWPRQAAQ